MHAGDDYETPDTKTMVVNLSALIDYADNVQDMETQMQNEIDMMDIKLKGEYGLELEEIVEVIPMPESDDYETPTTKTMVVTLSALIDVTDNGQDIERQIENEIDMMDLRLGGEYSLELEEIVEIYEGGE